MTGLAWNPDPYILLLTAVGGLIALVVWLPMALRRLPLSLPIVCVLIGMAVFYPAAVTFRPLPLAYPEIAERFTEFVVIIALMGAGLKIDRAFAIREWRITWRLLGVTMPLCIAAIAFFAVWMLGLPLPAALLLGAALAPTDPVLASDVQVGPPGGGAEDEVRFGLTSEAGLNDGLAFPFVHLAIALGLAASSGKPWLIDWLTFNVLWEIGAGVAGGWLVGRAFGWMTFHVPAKTRLSQTGDGLIALAATFVSYGFTEIIHSYGFVAVFVTALTIRNSHRTHDFQHDMHDIIEQIERLAMMAVLVLFGGALVSGLLGGLHRIDLVLVGLILFVVRPSFGLLGFLGMNTARSEKLTLAFFGIRGVGSFYYLAYGLNHMPVADGERLWAIVGLTVLVSIVLHGLTVTPIMRALDRSFGRDPDTGRAPETPPNEPSVTAKR